MGAWEGLFERRYGFWRGLLDGVVARYLDCGIFERGFARIRCPDCALLQRAGLLDEDRTRLLLSWHHSGFSVHNSVTVPAGDGRALEALARYCLQSPVSLARLRWTPGSETATYLPRDGHDDEKAEPLDALDFVARLLAHVPDPRRLLVHYYGAYSNVVRGKLKARNEAQQAEPLASGPGVHPPPPPACASPSSAALRRGWAQLLRRVYEIDPLVCPRCRAVMRVVSFITEGRVSRRILDHLGASAHRAIQDRAPPLAAGPVPDSP